MSKSEMSKTKIVKNIHCAPEELDTIYKCVKLMNEAAFCKLISLNGAASQNFCCSIWDDAHLAIPFCPLCLLD